MTNKERKEFEMQAYLETCKENGIVLSNKNNKTTSDIIFSAEDGKKYSVSKDMTVTEFDIFAFAYETDNKDIDNRIDSVINKVR